MSLLLIVAKVLQHVEAILMWIEGRLQYPSIRKSTSGSQNLN